MEISLSKILNEIVEEVTQDGTLTEGVDPSVADQSAEGAPAPAEETQQPEASSEDEELLAKIASLFTPEEAEMLIQKLESGEISEDDIIAHLASLSDDSGGSGEVTESYTPTLPIALAVGVGGLMYRNRK